MLESVTESNHFWALRVKLLVNNWIIWKGWTYAWQAFSDYESDGLISAQRRRHLLILAKYIRIKF